MKKTLVDEKCSTRQVRLLIEVLENNFCANMYRTLQSRTDSTQAIQKLLLLLYKNNTQEKPQTDGCIFPISFISDLGLVVIDVPLLVYNSIRIASSLFSISSQILVILLLFFCSKISVQAWTSLLTWLDSTSLGLKSASPKLS